MFLKRIEMQGFKSFADKVVITFDHSVTGIVGPNGCGKSNITDAIRWVLGEQSVKSLRGSAMSDIIFTGSENRRKVNFAEVTLVFDNLSRSFNTAYDEIEITRRLHRQTSEGEYLINKTPCRLKDILDLTMDSGIGRDSLSMISQGSISNFAESKPADRRAIFEEAAGVAKYKKRKTDSLAKLEKTQTNLERVNDIYMELQKQVVPLKRAAKKAEIYAEKKKRLQEIEIAVITESIQKLTAHLDDISKQFFDLQSKEAVIEATIQVNENSNLLSKTELHQLDAQIHAHQEELLKLINEIQTLETRKIEIDEKRKYTMEVGSTQEKTVQLKQLLDEAKQEYDDRAMRLRHLVTDVDLLNQQSIELNRKISDRSQQCDEASMQMHRVQNRLEVVKNLQARPLMSQSGVQAIMNAQQSLSGVCGVVAKLLTPTEGYEEAISVALGGAMYNIVTTDEQAARQSIGFLKKNESGRATFLPLTVMQARFVNRDHEIVCDNTQGFLGVGQDFVRCDAAYDKLCSSLLGNVLVVDNLEHGNNLAGLLRYNYKIVTLEGDVIHRGGSMTGGKQRDSASPMSMQKDATELEAQGKLLANAFELHQQVLQQLRSQKAELDSTLLEKRIAAAQLEPVVDAKRAKYERLLNDMDQLAPSFDGTASFEDDLITLLNKAYSRRDELNLMLRTKRDGRLKLSQDSERREQQIRQLRRELSSMQIIERDVQLDKTRNETKLEDQMNRLASEYQMTYEFALQHLAETPIENASEEVRTLRSEIESLGNINMNAPQEFEEINTRYEFLKQQYDELTAGKDKILSLINELDEIMVTQFKDMMDKINHELPTVFQAMFGGGKARLVLEDPEDILNSGVDIDVQPPGKAVQNIRLFSGGEKSLIAISVLFAILKARHVPLCIFDEIEAALDQSNVERFARYLKQFSAETQFLVVTHRPGTMAQCDVLYGVTMPKSGVSEMLKVHLSEAVSLAEETEVTI